jgi:CheY-like chemotaxis protein
MPESALYLAGSAESGVNRDPRENSTLASPAETANDSHQILLVEDSRAEADIFQRALEKASARVRAYWVASGREALEFLEQRGRFAGAAPVKVVVLDLNLPDLTGFEILRKIRENPVTKRQVTVLFSSSSNRRDVDLAYSLGANAYFVKPMSIDLYVAKVAVMVEHWLDLVELPH